MPRDNTVECPVCLARFVNLGGRRSHQKQKNHYPILKKIEMVPITADNPPPVVGLSTLSPEEKKKAKKARQKLKYLARFEAIKKMYVSSQS